VGRFDDASYVSMTMEFRCNLACVHCMIEGTRDRLEPESLARFDTVLEYNRVRGRWTGLILTGAEITLRRDLPELARRARQSGFAHVRIQTHGMRLASEAYCRELVGAGVDEFFVSVAAPDAALHDAITTVKGSFDKTMRGLENLDAYDHVSLLTNTVVTVMSHRHLAGIVERLKRLRRMAQHEFWVFWPMSEVDDKNLMASNLDVLPFLKDAIARTRQYGRGVAVKNFPHCLLGGDEDTLDNSQPRLFIDPSFWTEFNRNGFYQCVHRPRCRSTKCLGLPTAYAAKYGWHADVLSPIPASRIAAAS
jgi:MoaA/NifB/PqqE/SkfB family radical SAM enzyme